jgi:hypothetical protein
MVAITLALCALAVGLVADRGAGIDAAPQHTAAQAALETSPAVATAVASAPSFGSRIETALKVAESAPHGEIGTAAVATKP